METDEEERRGSRTCAQLVLKLINRLVEKTNCENIIFDKYFKKIFESLKIIFYFLKSHSKMLYMYNFIQKRSLW